VVDVTESPIEHPKKKQRRYYSGKKKRHTLKTQVVVNQISGQIICTAFGKGQVHDFRLFKTHRIPMLPTQVCLADKGYQGIANLHPCSCIPIKKPRKGKLSKAERRHNRTLASVRVVAEHVNRKLKIFRILAERYRNRRKRFGLRVNLIAAIINFELYDRFLIHARGLLRCALQGAPFLFPLLFSRDVQLRLLKKSPTQRC